ncbi:MAG: tetratricopeptide repeat protein [Elusimicrobiales bacterium]
MNLTNNSGLRYAIIVVAVTSAACLSWYLFAGRKNAAGASRWQNSDIAEFSKKGEAATLHRTALSELRAGQWDKSIEHYSRAISLYSKNEAYYFNRGLAYLNKSQYQNAIADFSKSIELNPAQYTGYLARGRAYSYNRNAIAAQADYAMAQELKSRLPQSSKPSPAEQQAVPDYNWGSKALKTGEGVVVEISPDVRWLPDTSLPERAREKSVIAYNNFRYFALQGVFVRYDMKKAEYDFYRVKPLSGSTIYGFGDIAPYNGNVLAGVMGMPLLVFDVEKTKFTGHLFEGRKNLVSFITDPYTGDIWLPTYGHVDCFHAAEKVWTNYDDAISNTLGVRAMSGAEIVAADEKYIWMAGSYRNNSTLIAFDKQKRQWKSFAHQLLNPIGNLDGQFSFNLIASSDKHIFIEGIWHHAGDVFLFIADKTGGNWRTYHADTLSTGMEIVLAELPQLSWGRSGFYDVFWNTGDSSDESAAFPQAVEISRVRFQQAVKQRRLAGERYYGFANGYLKDGELMERDGPEQQYETKATINLPEVSYKRVIAQAGDNRILVETNNGVAVFDCSANELKHFKPFVKLTEGAKILPAGGDGKFRVCEQSWDYEEDFASETDWRPRQFDLQTMTSDLGEKADGVCPGTAITSASISCSGKPVSLGWDGITIGNSN